LNNNGKASQLRKTAFNCDISVIIPNWDGIIHLRDCLSSLQKQTFRNFEVIVVDNGSKDDSVNFIKREYPWIKLIELSKNIGFSAACNLGIKAAKGRYIATLNNDTEVIPQWLGHLLKAAEKNEKIGMVASKILLSFETHEIDSVGMLIYPDGIGRQRGRGEIDNGQFDEDDEILLPSACAALYKMKMLEEIGLFDEDFFAYCEDTDIGLRGRLAGWKAVLAPEAVVYHKYSETGGKYSLFKALHVERNRIWVAVKNFPFIWLCKLPFYTFMRYLTQLYGVLMNKGSSARYKENLSMRDILISIIKANYYAIKKLPIMLQKRKTIRTIKTKKEFITILKKNNITLTELILKD
jgi:GT2 family glycosyltransferase